MTSLTEQSVSTPMNYSLVDPSDLTMQAVLQLARNCEYEVQHSHQVTFLALRLFDELKTLHQLGDRERRWLEYAGILHDIGWIEGWKGHHKATLRIILTTPTLLFSNKERLIIGSIARYHRKSLPSIKHDHYAALNLEERNYVNLLAALLRLADGLDKPHQSLVRDLSCKIQPHKLIVRCAVERIMLPMSAGIQDKSDLFRQVFQRKVSIQWKTML